MPYERIDLHSSATSFCSIFFKLNFFLLSYVLLQLISSLLITFVTCLTSCIQMLLILVLDEADRMLDMGFESQLRKIVEKLPAKRQTMM